MAAIWTWPPGIATTGVNPSPTGPGGSIVPGFSTWWADAPPTAPHACDDYFDGSPGSSGAALAAKWTVWNPGGAGFTLGVDSTKRMASFAGTALGPANALRCAGIAQPVPGTEWAAIAKVANIFNNASGGAETCAWEIGMFFAQDVVTNPTTADLYSFATFQFDNSGGAMNAQGMRGRQWSAYNATVGVLETGIDVRPYIRIRYGVAGVANAVRVETSPDGVSWYRLWNGVSAFAASYFGLYMNTSCGGTWTTQSTGQGYCKLFKVFSGAGSAANNASSIGRYV